MSCIIPPTILRQPESQLIAFGNTLTLYVIAYSSSPLFYKWKKNGVDIPGATLTTYVIPNVTFADTGGYTVEVYNILGSVLSAVATITVIDTPAFIGYVTVPSTLDTVPILNGSSFSITATVTGGALEYQWQKNGVDIPGATSNIYSIASVIPSDSGSYRITYKNPTVPIFTPAPSAINVQVINSPYIITQPTSIFVALGGSGTFTVDASGTSPLTYQWYKQDSGPILGATSPSITLSPVTLLDNGSYYVIITNPYGSVTSNIVTLTVVTAPTIISEPTGGSILSGGTFQMCVQAVGIGITYQWYKTADCSLPGTPIPDANSSCYQVTRADVEDGGSYYVTVTNIAGEVTSICVTLYVEFIDCVNGLIGFAGGAKEGANMASGLTSQKERVIRRCHIAEVLPRACNTLPQCISGYRPNIYTGGTSSGALLQSRIDAKLVCDNEINLALAKRRISVQPCSTPTSDMRFVQYQRLGPPVPCAPPPTGFMIPNNPAVPTAIDGPCVNVIGISVTRG